MRHLIVSIAFLLLMPGIVYGGTEDNFGDGERNINQFLNMTEEDETNDMSENNPGMSGRGEDEDAEESDQPPASESPNLFFLSIQLFLALGVVIFGIYALLKFINKRARSFNRHTTIQNIGGAGVGTNKSVQLVKVGNRILVVGVGDSVSLLKEIDDPDEIDDFINKHQSPQDMFNQPVSKMTGWLKKRRNGKDNNTQEAAFQSLLDRELNDVKKSHNKFHSAFKENDR